MIHLANIISFFLLVSVAIATTLISTRTFIIAARQHQQQQQNLDCFYTAVSLAGVPDNMSVSVSAAAGLLNREGPKVFTTRGHNEQEWQTDILTNTYNCPFEQVSPEQVIFNALQVTKFPRIVLYSQAEYNYTLASVLTIAGVRSAVPMSDELYKTLSTTYPQQFKRVIIIANTVGQWQTIYDAVSWTMDPTNNILQNTVSLSFSIANQIHAGVLVDLIVGGKYFAQGMPNSCLPGTQSNDIFQKLIAAAPWPRPIQVIGYNSQDPAFGGDIFEAETDCWGIHSMGQIASDGAQNLMFWSQLNPINTSLPRGDPQGPLSQPGPTPGIQYNASKKYVTLVYGDMDNLAFVETFGRSHMKLRAQMCQESPSTCFPFTWTMSPHLIDFAPSMIRWYYNRSTETNGKDTFIMPPSGALYAYPSMMNSQVQADFVKLQNKYANIMDTTGSIHWEWFFSWGEAFKTYFPRYVGEDKPDVPTTKNFFLLSVPWPAPWLYPNYTMWFGNTSDPSTNVMVTQKRFVWQAGGGGGQNLTPLEAAKKIEALEVGTTNYVYIIQNTPYQEVAACVANITDPLVEIVSYNDLGVLARQKEALFSSDRKN